MKSETWMNAFLFSVWIIFCQKSHCQLYSFIVTLMKQWNSCGVLSYEIWGSKALNQARLIAWTRPMSDVDQARSWIYLLCLSLMWKLVYLISFLGKLHCARDVLYLLGPFFFFPPFFFQKGFGSQSSRQGAPEISQGSLKAGGQRRLKPPPLPCSEPQGEVFHFLFCRLILLKKMTTTHPL